MFKSNAALAAPPPIRMSLNRYEQSLFEYLSANVDERRHWQAKIIEAARRSELPGEVARALERDLWDYFVERSEHVPRLRDLNVDGVRRVSLQNLSDHLLRLWGPPPKPKKPAAKAP